MESSHLRAEIRVCGAEGCPVAAASAECETTATDISWSRSDGDGRVVEEFTALGESDEEPIGGEFEPVFAAENEVRFRFDREYGSCICDVVESVASPVADVRAAEGDLVVTVYVQSVERLGTVFDRLDERYGAVSLRSLRQHGSTDAEDAVLVDRGLLTARQREVLETAIEMGYFEHPKGANASEVAEALDVIPSTLIEHLAAAQTKLFGAVFDE